MRALLNNMVIGVSTGFVKELEFHGIGYKVDVRGKELHLNVGYSNPRIHPIPDGIKAEVVKGAKVPTLKLSSPDKELLGKVASEVRKHRTPDSYKGKGIRYKGEVVRLKVLVKVSRRVLLWQKRVKRHWHVSVVNIKSERRCLELQRDLALLFSGQPSIFMPDYQ